MTNDWCEVLGIDVPSVEAAKAQPDANVYALLITALLERGAPLTLEEVARRFESAGIAPAERALISLKRCRPARPPVYRDGDEYSLDPHDEELGLWAFRLGMRPPAPARLRLVRDEGSAESDEEAWQAGVRALDRRRANHARKLASLRRVILHGFPAKAPRAVTLLDINERSLITLAESDLEQLEETLAPYDVFAAVNVRQQLRALDIDPGRRRLHELGPPQKSTGLNCRGKKLTITLPLLVTSSCQIGRPFGDPKKLSDYLSQGKLTQLKRRLEADAKSLHALYQYGRLHGGARLRWGYLDTFIPVPWAHPDEPGLHDLKKEALASGRALEVVVGSAPGWRQPWSRVRRLRVVPDDAYPSGLILDERGNPVYDLEVQAARILAGSSE